MLTATQRKMADEIRAHAARLDRVSTDNGRREWRETWDALNQKYDKAKIMNNSGQVNSRIGRDGGTLEAGPVHTHLFGGDSPQLSVADQATRGWLNAACGFPTSDDERAALASCGYGPTAGEIVLKLAPHAPLTGEQMWQARGLMPNQILNVQTAGTGSSGGFLVPQSISQSVERALQQYGGMMQVASVMRTETGEDLYLPQVNDVSNVGAILHETQQATEQDIAFTSLLLRSYTYTSRVVRVQNQLLRDSGVDLAREIGQLLGERIARATNQHFTTGIGGSQPKGILTGATVGLTAASATAISADEIIKLTHTVDPAYRNRNTAFMMNDSTFREISLLKSGEGEYLLRPGLAEGTQPTLRGWPTVINADFPDVGSEATPVMFGDFGRYVIRQVGELRLMKLIERWADFNQTGFLAFSSWDGALRDAGTNPVKVLKMAT